MTTKEVAYRLVELCRQFPFEAAYKELYHPDCVSIETEVEGEGRKVQGLEAIGAKVQNFNETYEVHDFKIEGPLVASNYFTVTMIMDVTNKTEGIRHPIGEVCVYKVVNGKIVFEQFFYHIPNQ